MLCVGGTLVLSQKLRVVASVLLGTLNTADGFTARLPCVIVLPVTCSLVYRSKNDVVMFSKL